MFIKIVSRIETIGSERGAEIWNVESISEEREQNPKQDDTK